MKKPNPIDYEIDSEYFNDMDIYQRYLLREEWERLGARNAIIGWSLILFTFSVICLSFYLYI